MKTKNILATIVFAVLIILCTMPVIASTGPGDPPGDPQSDPPLGGGAPIGGGVGILLAMGAAYGSKKIYTLYESSDDDILN